MKQLTVFITFLHGFIKPALVVWLMVWVAPYIGALAYRALGPPAVCPSAMELAYQGWVFKGTPKDIRERLEGK